LIIDYVTAHKDEFGVEPICTTLTSAGVQIAPGTYYAARTRSPSPRAVRDAAVKAEIARVHKANYGVYGIRKVPAQLQRERVLIGGRPVARCTTARLMRSLGLRGISYEKGPRTTIPGAGPDPRPDLVNRQFTATGQDRLWVADNRRCVWRKLSQDRTYRGL
jgi:putative transposase